MRQRLLNLCSTAASTHRPCQPKPERKSDQRRTCSVKRSLRTLPCEGFSRTCGTSQTFTHTPSSFKCCTTTPSTAPAAAPAPLPISVGFTGLVVGFTSPVVVCVDAVVCVVLAFVTTPS